MQILNLEDSVIGSMHQVTIEASANPVNGDDLTISIDGSQLHSSHEFHQQVCSMLESFNDHFAGITSKDIHIAELDL